VRSNLSAFAPDIAAARAAGLDYVLGESNSISCASSSAAARLAPLTVTAHTPRRAGLVQPDIRGNMEHRPLGKLSPS
jgi:hypothetical protein